MDKLRKYKTKSHKLIRCLIEIDDTIVQGCTFRFIGEAD